MGIITESAEAIRTIALIPADFYKHIDDNGTRALNITMLTFFVMLCIFCDKPLGDTFMNFYAVLILGYTGIKTIPEG